MELYKLYKYCPVCAKKLTKEFENLLVCASCGHHLYINPVPCNAVILENNFGEILLVKRKFEPQKSYWDLPGGFIKPGENYVESVQREVAEELSIRIEVSDVVGIYADSYLYKGVLNHTLAIISSGKILGGEIKPDDDVSGYEFVLKDKVLKEKLAFRCIKLGLGDYLRKSF